MLIIKVTLCLTLIDSAKYCIAESVFSSPARQVNEYLKQAASNQEASTNEHFHSPNSHGDSTQTEYINHHEKYQELVVDGRKIIAKIESSIPMISVHDDGTLIEKETMLIKHWPDYNSHKEENSNPRELVVRHRFLSNNHDDDDEDKEFFSGSNAAGKCREDKCQMEKESVIRSMSPPNDDKSFIMHRSSLEKINDPSSLNSANLQNSQVNGIYENFPLIENGQVSMTISPPVNRYFRPEFTHNERHRDRRQFRFVPATTVGLNNPQTDNRSFQADNKQSIIEQSIKNLDPSIIHSLLGVFDKMHPVFHPSFQRIKPNEILIVPPRYIDETKILSGPLAFHTTPTTRLEDTQSSVKNTPRNPNGFGESERVLTTDVAGNERQRQIIQDDFLPTLPPSTIPKITNNQAIQHSDEQLALLDKEEYYPENHQMPQVGKSMLSTGENLHQHSQPEERPEGLSQVKSYKHHSKDTKYDRYAANYSFKYHVTDEESENDFGHHETRNEQITDGNYHVRLPDGRIQRVNYYVDESGYHAKVSYEFDDRYYQKQAERNAK